MKLTKAMREEFVSSVMLATKWKNKWTAQKIADEMKRRALESEPADVKAPERHTTKPQRKPRPQYRAHLLK